MRKEDKGHVFLNGVSTFSVKHNTSQKNKKITYQVGNTVCYFPRADMFAVLGTGQDATEHFHHHSQTVAFVPS